MRYWRRIIDNYVIAVNCQLTPNWIEISKEEFDVLVLLRGKNEN